MNTWTAIALGIALLAANAFFVGAEFAIISARRSSIEPLAESGDRRARTVLWAMEHVSLMLACAQLGITVCSTSLGLVAEPAIAHLIEAPLDAFGVPSAWTHPIALVIALLIVVYLHVVLGEMVPKNLAVSGPDRAALWFGPPLVWVARAVNPVIWVLNAMANGILRLCRVEPKDEVVSAFTAAEVHSIVERSRTEGLLEDDGGLIVGAIEFSDKSAGQVMTPLETLVTVEPGITPEQFERLVSHHGYSRYPVRTASDDGAPGELSGYLHLKDVLYAEGDERTEPVAAWRVRRSAVVGPEDEVEDVLAAMQRSGSHLARVDGPEGPLGIVFLEDILEELVGEVRDTMQRKISR
ncbi:MAG: hemolysin family protein [Actinomycetota bacterium]|nr:hemolysin family protein [Actinomycetota bacterium]